MSDEIAKPHQSLSYIDTETTSLSPETGKIWEFAGIRYDFLNDEDAEIFSGVVQTPFGPARITRLEIQIEQPLGEADVRSLEIGHYYDRFGKNGFWVGSLNERGYPVNVHRGHVVPPAEAAKMIEWFLRGSSVMGVTVNFDHERLERMLRWEDQCPAWHYHPVDVKTYAAGVLEANGLELNFPWWSSEIREKLNVPEPPADVLHTAMGDVIWTRDVHWAAVNMARRS